MPLADAVRWPVQHRDAWPHVVAAAITATAVWLLGRALLAAGAVAPVETLDTGMQVFFIERVPRRNVIGPRTTVPSPRATAPMPAVAADAGAGRSTGLPQTSAALAGRLYTAGGNIKLPATATIDPLSTARPPGMVDERATAARKLLDRRNPIDYRPTRFDKDWVSSGTLGDVAAQKLAQRLEGVQALSKWVLGEDHAARARPPPEVRFNPALHERPSDLGNEATGDAYKAAPIAFEKAPDLKGEASRRIGSKLQDLQQRHAGCDPQRVLSLLAPVRMHLADLQQVEYALAHGVDPIEAEHLLPRTADRAYDLARRALWYAERELGACRNPSAASPSR